VELIVLAKAFGLDEIILNCLGFFYSDGNDTFIDKDSGHSKPGFKCYDTEIKLTLLKAVHLLVLMTDYIFDFGIKFD
jgi:hypothetical protein